MQIVQNIYWFILGSEKIEPTIEPSVDAGTSVACYAHTGKVCYTKPGDLARTPRTGEVLSYRKPGLRAQERWFKMNAHHTVYIDDCSPLAENTGEDRSWRGWRFPLFAAAAVQRLVRSSLLIPVLVCLAGGTLIWLHTLRLVDGVQLEPRRAAWQDNGMLVTPQCVAACGLRTGDVVVAVAGQGMALWAQALFQPGAARPQWRADDVITYTVLRDGERVDVSVQLGRLPLGVQLARNWSAVLFALSAQLVTLFVLWRRPADVAARALFVWAWSLAASLVWLLGLHVSDLVGGGGFWLYTLSTSGAWLLSWGAIMHFALVFPQRHALVLRWPRLIAVVYAAPFVLYLALLALNWLLAATTLAWLAGWQEGNWQVAVVYLLAATVVIVQQHQASQGVTRRKIRWLVLAALLSLCASLLLWFLPSVLLGRSLISTSALGLLALPYPLALASALLHHHLFDIEIIIRRTLVYSLLSLALTLVYLLSVPLLQWLLRPLTVQGHNQVVTSLATLAIAALFRPVQRRVQDAIDRRFYRRRYDHDKVLAAFSARMRDETDVDRLTTQLAVTAVETLQPAHLSLWLAEPGSGLAIVGAAGRGVDPAHL